MQAFHYTAVPSEPAEGREGVAIRWAIGQNVNAPNFILRVIEIQPEASTAYHQHPWEHEVFILEGQATVRGANGEVLAGPGTCVYVAPNEWHQFLNAGKGLLRFICVIPKPQ